MGKELDEEGLAVLAFEQEQADTEIEANENLAELPENMASTPSN